MRAISSLLPMLALLVALVLLPAGPAHARADKVDALGVGYISGPSDIDAARRRAIGDALVAAALQGGARIQGISVLNQGTIRTDLTLFETAAEVSSYRILSQTRHADRWEVRISARVRPPLPLKCQGNSHLVVTMRPPRVTVTPSSPAWAAQAATHLAHALTATIRASRHATLDSIVAERSTRVSSEFDYATLMRGQAQPAKGNSILDVAIDIAPAKGTSRIGVDLHLTMLGPDGRKTLQTTRKHFVLPKSSMLRAVAGHARQTATAEIAGLTTAVESFLQNLACQPPAAILALEGDLLSIPLGSRHGISPGSLGVPDLTLDGLALLEVIRIEPSRTLLRPLDPSLHAKQFAKRRVYLVKAGLRD